jgi:hypothetical protein
MKIITDIPFKKLDAFLQKEQAKPFSYKTPREFSGYSQNEEYKRLQSHHQPHSEKLIHLKEVIDLINQNSLLNPFTDSPVKKEVPINLQGFKSFSETLKHLITGTQHHAAFDRSESKVHLHSELISRPDYFYNRFFEHMKKQTVLNWVTIHEIGHVISFVMDEKNKEHGFFAKEEENIYQFFKPWENHSKFKSIILENYGDLYSGFVLSYLYPEQAPGLIRLLAQNRQFEFTENYMTHDALWELADQIEKQGNFNSFDEFNRYASKACSQIVVEQSLKHLYANKSTQEFSHPELSREDLIHLMKVSARQLGMDIRSLSPQSVEQEELIRQKELAEGVMADQYSRPIPEGYATGKRVKKSL